MDGGRERRWGEYVTSIPAERIMAVFPDAGPRKTEEVAEAAGVTEHTAVNRLEDLVEEGRLGRRSLEVDGATVSLWWLTGEEHVERASSPEPADGDGAGADHDAVEAALADLELPGASELMREWRRDAVRAAYHALVERGSMADEEVVDAVYPSHQAGYTDRDRWWEMIAPRLRALPGVWAPRWPGQLWSVGGSGDDSLGDEGGIEGGDEGRHDDDEWTDVNGEDAENDAVVDPPATEGEADSEGRSGAASAE